MRIQKTISILASALLILTSSLAYSDSPSQTCNKIVDLELRLNGMGHLNEKGKLIQGSGTQVNKYSPQKYSDRSISYTKGDLTVHYSPWSQRFSTSYLWVFSGPEKKRWYDIDYSKTKGCKINSVSFSSGLVIRPYDCFSVAVQIRNTTTDQHADGNFGMKRESAPEAMRTALDANDPVDMRAKYCAWIEQDNLMELTTEREGTAREGIIEYESKYGRWPQFLKNP